MKIEIQEYDSGFYFNILPETIAESALLLRVSAQSKKEPLVIRTLFYKDINTEFILRKKKNSDTSISNGAK